MTTKGESVLSEEDKYEKCLQLYHKGGLGLKALVGEIKKIAKAETLDRVEKVNKQMWEFMAENCKHYCFMRCSFYKAEEEMDKCTCTTGDKHCCSFCEYETCPFIAEVKKAISKIKQEVLK